MTTKNESPSSTPVESIMPKTPAELMALIVAGSTAAIRELLAQQKPSFDQVTDLIADRKKGIAERPRVQTIAYRGCVERESESTFDAICQPSPEFPGFRIVLNDNTCLAPHRTRAIYELAFGGESDAMRKIAVYTQHGPQPGMSDSEIEKLDRDAKLHGYQLAELHRAAQSQIKDQTLHDLIMPVRRLVGMTVAQAKRYTSFPSTYEVLDEGLRSPFALPPQGA